MILKELYRTEQDGKTLVAIGNGNEEIDEISMQRLQVNSPFWALINGRFVQYFRGSHANQFYALELSDFEKFNSIGEEELQAAEKPKVYWSKPSHFPPVCWVREKDKDCCTLIIKMYGDPLKITMFVIDLRWSDRPFDRWEDGKECLVEE